MKLRDLLLVPVVLALCACTTPSNQPSDAVRHELAPTGRLRFGVVAGAERTEFFVVKGADGYPNGVTVDLARELGRRLAAPVEFVVASSSGQLTEMLSAGKLDAAIMPPDEERRKILDFGTYYFVDENTYMVPGGSKIKTIADVDYPGARVIAIVGTTTSRTAARLLKSTTVTSVKSIDDALEMLRTGKADAFALTHASLAPLVPRVPGARILEGSFNRIGIAIAIPKNRPNALSYVTAFTEDAKASGFVQRAFDNAGLKASKPAAPGER
jgi:polar amino acid transport system substrate-binding protein